MWDQVVEVRRRTGQVQPSGGPVLLLPLYDALMGENWTRAPTGRPWKLTSIEVHN